MLRFYDRGENKRGHKNHCLYSAACTRMQRRIDADGHSRRNALSHACAELRRCIKVHTHNHWATYFQVVKIPPLCYTALAFSRRLTLFILIKINQPEGAPDADCTCVWRACTSNSEAFAVPKPVSIGMDYLYLSKTPRKKNYGERLQKFI